MILWRISMFRNLDGDGGMLSAGRWHNVGQRIVYTSEHPAISLLEMIVHADRQFLPTTYQLLKIHVPNEIKIRSAANTGSNWQVNTKQSQTIGDVWLSKLETAVLKVPCAILPESWNYLINPQHPDASSIKIESAQTVPVDERLMIVE
jgi:RES domain-containing protein